MHVRPSTDADWPDIRPIFREIVEAGDTYVFHPALTVDQAQDLWMERPPSQVVVALAGGGPRRRADPRDGHVRTEPAG